MLIVLSLKKWFNSDIICIDAEKFYHQFKGSKMLFKIADEPMYSVLTRFYFIFFK